jgi:hypothetical protein
MLPRLIRWVIRGRICCSTLMNMSGIGSLLTTRAPVGQWMDRAQLCPHASSGIIWMRIFEGIVEHIYCSWHSGFLRLPFFCGSMSSATLYISVILAWNIEIRVYSKVKVMHVYFLAEPWAYAPELAGEHEPGFQRSKAGCSGGGGDHMPMWIPILFYMPR